MTAKKSTTASPTLKLSITDQQHQRAVQSDSGSCLIADAIKAQYPHLSSVSVDMATIRVSDRKRGLRYVYLTPPEAQHLLLSFDQGWTSTATDVTIRRAVKINVIARPKTGEKSIEQTRLTREEKRAALEAKIESGQDLTRSEKAALTRLRQPYNPVERPAAQPPVTTVIEGSGTGGLPTIIGGQPIVQGPAHPNLLRSRNRHFGAKVASPGVVWEQAVNDAVAERLAVSQGQPVE